MLDTASSISFIFWIVEMLRKSWNYSLVKISRSFRENLMSNSSSLSRSRFVLGGNILIGWTNFHNIKTKWLFTFSLYSRVADDWSSGEQHCKISRRLFLPPTQFLHFILFFILIIPFLPFLLSFATTALASPILLNHPLILPFSISSNSLIPFSLFSIQIWVADPLRNNKK